MTLFPALVATLIAAGGNDVVIVLDNSGSMGIGARTASGEQMPPNDPERAAVLGTLLVEGLARGSADRVTVLAFGNDRDAPARVARTADEIRALPYTGGTFFRRPLEEARRLLAGSSASQRLFLFFTDGSPEDLKGPQEGPQLLGLADNAFDTLIIGLYASDDVRRSGELFLRPLARSSEDLVFVQKPREIVSAFTRGYARALGSRPETGVLAPGEKHTFQTGKYVVEVLVAVASADPGKPFTSALAGPGPAVVVQASGDNGCGFREHFQDAPRLCEPPFRHYQVFRAANDATQPANWTLSLPQADGAVDYGVILRYDLAAAVAVPPTTRVSEPVTIDARLLFRGQTFDDEAFFSSDGFEAVANAGGQQIPLVHKGGGRFEAQWTPAEPSEPGAKTLVQVIFRNTWMEKRALQGVSVEGFLDLALRPTPSRIDLGQWRAERSASRRCAQVNLAGSTNADRVPVQCAVSGDGQGGALSCTPATGSEATLPGGRRGQPLVYDVCFEAPRCCGDLAPAALSVSFAGANPHYAPGAVSVPVAARVERTGFWRCYWIWFAITGALLFAIWVVAGFVRPCDFDPGSSAYVAGSEAGLRRASAMVLRELPGGRRGFYRSARMCLNAGGDFIRSPAAAVLVVEATGGGLTRFRRAQGLERKIQRTGRWEPVPESELAAGFMTNQLYRSGGLYLKWS